MKRRGLLTCRLILLGALVFTGCSDQVTPGTGEKSRQLGEDCDQEHDCLEGLFCEGGKCRQPCTSNSDCKTGSSCQDGRCVIDVVDTAECGNGVQEVNETCDDGNTENGDCCSATCNLEANCYCEDLDCSCKEGFRDNNDGKGCVAAEPVEEKVCGDGLLQPGEECDDHNNKDNDCCSAECKLEPNCTCQATSCHCLTGFILQGTSCVKEEGRASGLTVPAGFNPVNISGTLSNGTYTVKITGGSLVPNSKENSVMLNSGSWQKTGE